MTWTKADTLPTLPGWYAVKQYLSDRPIVLWWRQGDTVWRAGATIVRIDAWLGPLP